MTPSLLDLPAGCAFAARCDRTVAGCGLEQSITEPVAGRRVRCCRPLLEQAAP
jgi:peptide/nickel transport system ATP-binding protein